MAINLFSFINNTNNASENSAAPKNYMDNKAFNSGFDFTKVFDNVSKNLNEKQSETKSYNEMISKQPENTNRKTEEKKEPQDSHEVKKEEPKQQASVEQKDETHENQPTENKSEKAESDKETQEADKVVKEEDSKEQTVSEQPKTTVEANMANLVQEKVNELLTLDVAVQAKASSSEDKKADDTSSKTHLQKNNIKVQPQTQQAILNMDVPKEEIPTEALQEDTQAPKIKVAEEIMANLGAKVEKAGSKDALSQTSLNQEILDKTNAQVVSIETTTSDNSGLLNNQNAQEQGIKVALNNLQTQGAGSTQTTQASFESNLQNATQTKELSRSEILSQIHAKMDSLKDETSTRVTIVLKPESLGKINLELINGKDGLSARMTTENAQVKELLDKSLDELKKTLSSQGINVSNVSVKVSETQETANEGLNFEQGQFQQSNQQLSSDNSESFTDDGFEGFEENVAQMSSTEDIQGQDDIPLEAVLSGNKVDYKI